MVPILLGISQRVSSQDRLLVWADEFNGPSVDTSVWQFESGPSNDNVQYYTDRPENATIEEGRLKLIALKESYQEFGYTSAHIRTEKAHQWRYGRMEARIKLPGTPGFVPAFWMIPADNQYGWWPYSGEIDIMEHPSNEVTRIYGTVHTGAYNLFNGSQPPRGGVVEIPDAESAFHVYAVDWTPEQIDFYVDDQHYYSFVNDRSGADTWPFDQPFYLILNLAVGGGWVGTPDESTVFPAMMEVDYVRVYQHVSEMEIQGADFVLYNTRGVTYHLGDLEAAEIRWSVPGGARIISGQGSSQITVDWGIFGGEVVAEITSGEGTFRKIHSVKVSPGLIKNMGFEKGVKYWRSASGYPSKASFSLQEGIARTGNHSVFAEVTDPGVNSWDVQLSQQDLKLQGGTRYLASIAVRSEGTQGPISAAVIDASNFALVGQQSISPAQEWGLYEFNFTAPSDMASAFNIDLGGQSGSYFLDDISLTSEALMELNLVKNPDFFDGEQFWELLNLSSAVSTGSVVEGEYAVSVTNGGENAWDIHLGQTGLTVEKGYEYLFSFDAYASAPRQIRALVGMNRDPWTVYSDADPFTLSTTKQTYSLRFIMDEPTDLQSRLGFDIGGELSGVFIDNILLKKEETTSTGINRPGQLVSPDRLLQNFPNPVKNETRFYYLLDQPAHVSLGIYNLNGQQVSMVVNEAQNEGEHEVSWKTGGLPPGIYFCRFDSGGRSETRKLIILP